MYSRSFLDGELTRLKLLRGLLGVDSERGDLDNPSAGELVDVNRQIRARQQGIGIIDQKLSGRSG